MGAIVGKLNGGDRLRLDLVSYDSDTADSPGEKIASKEGGLHIVRLEALLIESCECAGQRDLIVRNGKQSLTMLLSKLLESLLQQQIVLFALFQ